MEQKDNPKPGDWPGQDASIHRVVSHTQDSAVKIALRILVPGSLLILLSFLSFVVSIEINANTQI